MTTHRARRPSGYCPLCGTWRQSLHREHIIPKWKGGADDESNIQYICANCHEDKTREDNKGIPSRNKGKVFSLETRQKMSNSAAARIERNGYNILPMRGVKNGRAKVTDEQVEMIRKQYAAGGVTYQQLGDQYGLSKSGIYQIIQRKKWNTT